MYSVNLLHQFKAVYLLFFVCLFKGISTLVQLNGLCPSVILGPVWPIVRSPNENRSQEMGQMMSNSKYQFNLNPFWLQNLGWNRVPSWCQSWDGTHFGDCLVDGLSPELPRMGGVKVV